MKVLISNDSPCAHYYIRIGIARVFAAMGWEVNIWDINSKSAIDMFDEFNPDLFIGQTYNINRPLRKAIEERPWMKVVMKAGDWGKDTDLIPPELQVLKASEIEIENTIKLYEKTGKPDYVDMHYPERFIKGSHGYWEDNGIPIHSRMCAADIFEYTNGKPRSEFKCDIAFVGGYWPYKAQVFDKYLIPLCQQHKHNIKIFGNGIWPTPQYCGMIPSEMVKDLFASATICPALHEPHSQVLGKDIIEREFKLLSNKCFVISDYVAALETLFGYDECMILAKTPEEFFERIDYFMNNKDERLPIIERGYREVIEKHTYFHRVFDMLNRLNLKHHAQKCMSVYDDVKRKLAL